MKTSVEKKLSFCRNFTFIFAVLHSFCSAFGESEDHVIGGQLHGKILTPPGADISSIIIQVIGANQDDKFHYQTSPNAQGEFNFDGILPPSSVVQLYIWDGQGLLNSTVLNAYVSQHHAKEIPEYDVAISYVQYTQDVAQIYNTTHNLTSTGICGYVNYSRRKNESPVKILAYDRYAKYAGPMLEQNLDEQNKFCFFNLSSASKTDMYDFVLVNSENEKKTFTYYLPPSTFIHNAFLDAQASIYKPIHPYYWEDSFLKRGSPWKALDSINLSTSDDYTYVNYDNSRENENLFYFPLSNELLEISYFLTGENKDHFFLLLPRIQLFCELNIDSNSDSKSIYVDYDHPLPLGFITEPELIKLNPNYYFQTFHEQFGSTFVTLGLKELGVKSADEIKLTLRNSAGQDVGNFEELITVQNDYLVGFFFHLLPGRYQFFVTNKENQLLWTYEVRSYPNRVQILTNDVEGMKSVVTKPIHPQRNRESVFIPLRSVETVDGNYHLSSMREEQLLTMNNMIYYYDAELFCTKKSKESFLQMLENTKGA